MKVRFVALLFFAFCISARADEPVATTEQSAPSPVEEEPEIDRTPSTAAASASPEENSQPRLTLELRDAPLLQVLHLLSQTGAAKFRYGTPPDAVVSVRWNDEAPFDSLNTTIQNAGWRLQRESGDYFLLPGAAQTNFSAEARGAWTQWMAATTPPREALTGFVDNAKVSMKDAKIVSQPENARTLHHWRPLEIALDATRAPGISLAMQKAGDVWLRCQVPLRVVPRGTRLMLETTQSCDVLINGAPLARRWNGIKTFDVEPLLRRGANTIVVRWRAPYVKPTFRYEWIFAGGAAGGGLPGETARDTSQ